jgi:hypothetical protein
MARRLRGPGAHGRPMPRLGHYLKLGLGRDPYAGQDVRLNSIQIVGPPGLPGCQGSGQSSGDPLTLATIALARGSRQILVT